VSAQSEFKRLLDIMKKLRSPQGCPWDRAQTHASIRDNMVEEVYEAVEAIDSQNDVALQEELGDLALHIVFHAQIATESGKYTIEDVLKGINNKLIRRHPHVFADQQVENAEQVLSMWEDIKKKEREDKPQVFKETFGSLPKAMPALIYAQEIQKRAKDLGFDWSCDDDVLQKLNEEIKETAGAPTEEERTLEFGDVLFTLTNLANRWGISLEEALRRSSQKFCARFNAMEELARKRALNFKMLSLEEKDSLWREIKTENYSKIKY